MTNKEKKACENKVGENTNRENKQRAMDVSNVILFDDLVNDDIQFVCDVC